jgi:peptidyl-prolyl cis-trans isomerase C
MARYPAPTRPRLCVLAACLSLLAACSSRDGPAAGTEEAADATTAAIVDAYAETRTNPTSGAPSPALREQYETDVARLVAAAARVKNDPRAQARAELARLESLARDAARSAGVYEAPDEAEVVAEYQAFLDAQPASEYHLAHILVATRPLAEAALTELSAGRPFADVARRLSTDDSNSRGGDLGWVRRGHLPDALFDAADGVSPGHFAPDPVQTEYGWHVVSVLETRRTEPAPLDRIRTQLVANIQLRRWQQFIETATASSTRPAGR